MSSTELVRRERRGPIVEIILNRPEVRNAQSGALLHDLERAFYEFAQDDDLAVAILTGAGTAFSSGHDIGPHSDRDQSFPRWSMWWDHSDKQGVERRLAREEELYLGLCVRWRTIPKPTIAMVNGPCIAGGLMLAWACDLIYAAESAYFSDPVVAFGLPGVEYFAHPWVMGSRRAKEFLFTGGRMTAQEAHRAGMVNRVVADDDLRAETLDVAERIASMPRLGLTLAKESVNACEDAMGFSTAMNATFALHQLGHAHNAEVTGDPNGGLSPTSVKQRSQG